MDNKQAPSNVLQFPGKKKEVEAAVPNHTPAVPPPVPKAAAKRKKSKTTAGTVLAIILATGAVNHFTYTQNLGSVDASSFSNASRTIASIEPVSWQRDAAWEKDLAESLASAQERNVASTGLGHSATAEEKLRWGTLEEKYTILYDANPHNIKTIVLQDPATNPSYVLDRSKFLGEYGQLLQSGFASAELKSVEVSDGKTVEQYTLFNKDKRPVSEARFELDNHKRLLSLKVEPATL